MWKPELIICDVEMPVLSGPEMALQVFLKDAGDERIPILLISGVAELHLVAQKVGASCFLGKPFTVEKLLAKLALAATHYSDLGWGQFSCQPLKTMISEPPSWGEALHERRSTPGTGLSDPL